MPPALPLPPKELRIWVGPFADPDLFARSGEQMASQIIRLTNLKRNAQVLDVGCGCGRLARALAGYLSNEGRYEGIDAAGTLVEWCQRELQPLLPNFRFSFADVRAGELNPRGAKATAFRFPFPDAAFDLAILSSVFTHMLPDEIEAYLAQLFRVLKPGGRCFMSVFLFDGEAELAVAGGATIFDFRYPLGECLTFNPHNPQEGIACRKAWLLRLIETSGLRVETVRRGDWRRVRSHKVMQDYVIAQKPARAWGP